jgi:hypothetical protein
MLPPPVPEGNDYFHGEGKIHVGDRMLFPILFEKMEMQ